MLRVARRYSGIYVDRPLFLQRIHPGLRGTSADRFTSELSPAKWFAYDRIIFERLLPDLTLGELTPPFARLLPANQAHRAAILERACIAGRHAMWSECVADLEQACALMPAAPATIDEQAIVKRMLSEPDAVPYLVNEHVLIQRLQAILRSSEFGRCIASSFASPLFWQIKACLMAQETTAVRSYLHLLIALLGVRRVAGRGLMLMLRRLALRHPTD
jgi:hypothetical protein